MSKSILMKFLICGVFIILLSNTFYFPVSHAIGDVFSQGKNFLMDGDSIYKTINTQQLNTTSSDIYNILLAIATVVAVIVSMILGIQFMVASTDEKAKVKEAILPFVIGCIVVFGAFTIWKIAVNVGNSAEEATSEVKSGERNTT